MDFYKCITFLSHARVEMLGEIAAAYVMSSVVWIFMSPTFGLYWQIAFYKLNPKDNRIVSAGQDFACVVYNTTSSLVSFDWSYSNFVPVARNSNDWAAWMHAWRLLPWLNQPLTAHVYDRKIQLIYRDRKLKCSRSKSYQASSATMEWTTNLEATDQTIHPMAFIKKNSWNWNWLYWWEWKKKKKRCNLWHESLKDYIKTIFENVSV